MCVFCAILQVVLILEKRRKATQIGALTTQCPLIPGRPLPASESYVFFQPADLSYPNLVVPRLELPANYTDNPSSAQNDIFIAEICDDWSVQSKLPFAKNIRSVGESGSIHAEIEAALIQNEISHGAFTDEMMQPVREMLGIEDIDGVTRHADWKIPEQEIARRLDLRSYRIFTIDPPTAKDLDDAVHIEDLGNDVYSIG